MTVDDEYRNILSRLVLCVSQSNLGARQAALEFEGSCFATSCRRIDSGGLYYNCYVNQSKHDKK